MKWAQGSQELSALNPAELCKSGSLSEGNHGLASSRHGVLVVVLFWRPGPQDTARSLEAPGGHEDICAAAPGPHGLHCPQL